MSRAAIAIASGTCLVIGTVAMIAATSPAEQKAGIAFWALSGLIILIGIVSEVGSSAPSSPNVHTEVHVHNYAPSPQHQAQYVPVHEPAPQIIYVEREAPPPQTGMTPADVKQLFAQLLAEHQQQMPPPKRLERQLPAQVPDTVRIDGGYRSMDVLLPARTMPAKPELLRGARQKKSIADRVAVALLTKPKTRA